MLERERDEMYKKRKREKGDKRILERERERYDKIYRRNNR